MSIIIYRYQYCSIMLLYMSEYMCAFGYILKFDFKRSKIQNFLGEP